LGAVGPPPADEVSSNIFSRSILERAGLASSPKKRSADGFSADDELYDEPARDEDDLSIDADDVDDAEPDRFATGF
jgi:hypothetical protein